jgi:hypothetical protein
MMSAPQFRKNPAVIKYAVVIMLLIILGQCKKSTEPESAAGTLEFSFIIKDPVILGIDPLPYPSTAIWLEDKNGKYVTSLLVSQWLGTEGYEESSICPSWQQASAWPVDHTEAEIDAVTMPTPSTYNLLYIYTYSCSEKKLAAGTYIFKIETSVDIGYNILATGEIEIGGADKESSATYTYSPEVHPEAGEALSNVKVKYSS